MIVSAPLVFAAVVLAAAPVKDSPAEAKAVAVADWFPVKDGSHWEFEIAKVQHLVVPGRPEMEQKSTEKVVDRVTADKHFFEMVSTRDATSDMGTRKQTLRSRLSVDGEGVRVHEQTLDYHDGDAAQTSEQKAPMVMLPARVRPGDRWTVGTMQMGGLLIELSGEVLGFETVTTPAGAFERCLKIAHRGTSSGKMTRRGRSVEVEGGTIEETIWFAPGVGEVKQQGQQSMKLKLPDGVVLETRETKEKLLVRHGVAGAEPAPTAAPKK